MIKVKTFGVIRLDSGVKEFECNATTIMDAFDGLNSRSVPQYGFKDAIVFINGERTTKKNANVKDGDEVWIMSPVSGG